MGDILVLDGFRSKSPWSVERGRNGTYHILRTKAIPIAFRCIRGYRSTCWAGHCRYLALINGKMGLVILDRSGFIFSKVYHLDISQIQHHLFWRISAI